MHNLGMGRWVRLHVRVLSCVVLYFVSVDCIAYEHTHKRHARYDEYMMQLHRTPDGSKLHCVSTHSHTHGWMDGPQLAGHTHTHTQAAWLACFVMCTSERNTHEHEREKGCTQARRDNRSACFVMCSLQASAGRCTGERGTHERAIERVHRTTGSPHDV